MKNYSQRKSSKLAALSMLLLVTGTLFSSACGSLKRAENEAAAIRTLQTLAVNERLYYKQHQGNAYGTFDQLITDVNLDKKFAGDAPVVSGYVFKMTLTERLGGQPPFYSINADPLQSEGLDATGKNHYYIDVNADTVKVNDAQPAGPDDPPVSQ